jgi:hypothetical protein
MSDVLTQRRQLACDLGLHKDGSLIWLASLGLTDQLLGDRIDPCVPPCGWVSGCVVLARLSSPF